MKKFLFAIAALFSGLIPFSHAHDPVESMSNAANDFLNSLTEEQKAKASYEVANPERTNWHFIPKPFEGDGKRGGLPLKEMRADQKHLAYGLLSTGLSNHGFTKALQVMSLEQILWEMENAPKRNPEMYYVSIFGKPGSKGWGWRVEGHHISMNFTIAGGKLVSGTPSFYASNPGEVPSGPRKGLRVLAEEEDVARKLAQSLSDDQKGKAIFEEKPPRDILTSAESTVKSLGDVGLAYAELNDAQKKNLHDLIDVYVHRLRPEFAAQDLKKIESKGHDKIVFAWAGGINKGDPHYYRVQGPSFLLEYANTQNGANHVHAVWRDFKGDFGRDILKEHFAEHHKGE